MANQEHGFEYADAVLVYRGNMPPDEWQQELGRLTVRGVQVETYATEPETAEQEPPETIFNVNHFVNLGLRHEVGKLPELTRVYGVLVRTIADQDSKGSILPRGKLYTLSGEPADTSKEVVRSGILQVGVRSFVSLMDEANTHLAGITGKAARQAFLEMNFFRGTGEKTFRVMTAMADIFKGYIKTEE